MLIINFVSSGAAWPITLGLGVGLGAGYSNCRHQFLWHGPHGPPFHFGRPPWAGGGRPYWGRPSKDGEKHPPCHEEQKVFLLLAVIVQICWISSVASKYVHVREKHVLIRCKHDMFCHQMFDSSLM